LHDDEECVVVNKASGVVVQPTDGEAKERASGPPLVELLKHYWKRKHAPVVNPYVIQRLDKGTSGVMVLGKTVHAQRFLQRQASDRLMERRYLALVHGNMTRDSGTWRTYLGLDESNRRRSVIRLRDDQPLLTEYPEDVKLAITHFKVMERYPRATLLELRLETGRTHQIRIHCAETAHPLIGDGVYIHLAQHLFPNIKFEEGIPRAPRMMLHAAHLKFQHPGREGRWLTFRAEMPEPMVLFQELLQSPRLRKPQ
ncbi:MAG: RluA family pseudouridine synthase, partial [Candidatus Sumerlaeia bacterium]|nr:RluA family pseudouridine synthase [Candidatus Sumerlaeia bacterium]